MKRKKKILVGMSGGIDSSVAALILKEKGFDVSGGFIVFEEKNNRCCVIESKNRARRAAKAIGIPFYSFDFKKEFKGRIISRFIDGYKAGITPNPCVDCNKEIKFGLFLDKALALKFDYVATGHYVRKRKMKGTGKFMLLKGKDENKDQSYFLWKLNQKQLKRILFPLGNYTKEETRKKAAEFNLPNLDAKESQEACFLKNGLFSFLKDKIKTKEGEIVDIKGKKIGKHQGVHFYTLGQRKGLGLPGGPYFVVGKDASRNLLIVSKNKKDLFGKELIAAEVNWIDSVGKKEKIKAKVKIRHHHQPAAATILKINNRKCKIIFNKPQQAITPGQSVVFYKRKKLLGGGIIRSSFC